MSFRWQTDEDKGETVASVQKESLARRRLARALWLLAAIGLVALAAFLTWRTLQQRAARVEARAREDVLSIHELAEHAASTGDDELYLTLLPPQLEGWVETQQELLQDDLVLAGAAQLYELFPLPAGSATPEVTLDPSLSQATVFSQRAFAVSRTARLSDAIVLRQAQSYILGDTGWQVAPPPPNFWSPQIRLHGDMLTLEYPQRDEAVALRLLSELNRLLPELCALPGLNCPRDFHLTLRLVPDPVALARAAAPEAMLRGASQLDLPAPSLVGQPVDQAGEVVVARAYAAHSIAPLISHLSSYNCCDRALLARAIVERQLYHLGLRAWPLGPDDYEVLVEQGLSLGEALILQSADLTPPHEDKWRQMLSVVQYLEASLPPGALLSSMQRSLDQWLVSAGEPGDFVVQWTRFVYDRSRSAFVADALDPPPKGAIQLTCYDRDSVAILRYDLEAAGWQYGLTYAAQDGWQVETIVSLPADYGNVIKEARRGASGTRNARYVWRHSAGATVLFETMPGVDGAALFAPYDGSAPHWRYTVLSPEQTALRTSLEQEWWQLDLTVCAGGLCQRQQRIARPRWSPDGAQLLLEAQPQAEDFAREDLTLFRAGSRGQNAYEVGPGYAPVWLDAARYAYLRATDDASRQELVVAAASDDSRHVVANNEALSGLLESSLQAQESLQLERIEVNPTNPRLLLVHAKRSSPNRNEAAGDAYLFALRLSPNMRQLQEIELIYRSDGQLDVRPSPNGRWLVATDFNRLTLIDLEEGRAIPLGSVSSLAWSPDGHWLVQFQENHLLLRAPGLDYKRPVVQQLTDCPFNSLQWQ